MKSKEQLGWARWQRLRDIEALLGTDAGKRVFGALIERVWLGAGYELDGFQQGQRDTALRIASDIREIDPRLIGECDMAYQESLTRAREEDGEYGGS